METTFKFPEKKEMRVVSSFEPHQQSIAYKVVELEENKYLMRKLEEKTETLGEVLQMYTILKQGYENVVEQCNDIVVKCTNDLEKRKT